MARPIEPIACDCCGKALLPVFGTFHRVEREFGWASLPYVLCGDCALQHRGRPTDARVLEWIQRRADRAGADWGRSVGQLLQSAARVVDARERMR
ncbi:TPA: hypothetical protein UMT99_001193 [Stenotrophomonas maltophilia]|nr:hypothetical protein [Stenotrophomonas maltophilia]